MSTFFRFDLRTTDVGGAGDFYAKILGHDRSVIWPLHEQALARGATPHWLGTLEVDDVERAAAAFIERGATRLGPTPATGRSSAGVVLRDPGGALVAFATRTRGEVETGVVWHVLHTNGLAQATKSYVEQFGWELRDRVDVGAEGVFTQFAWGAAGMPVGAMGDIAGRPGLHPHWLFFFEVTTLEVSTAEVQAAGGSILPPTTLPSGQRVCVCHDPQGAEFGLWEKRPPLG